MSSKEYIESGAVELFVVGKLDAQEMQDISASILEFPELKEEVIRIEKKLISLSELVAPYLPEHIHTNLSQKLTPAPLPSKIIQSKRFSIIAWAAIFVLASLLTWSIQENQQINIEIAKTMEKIDSTKLENNQVLEQLAEKSELLQQLRNPDLIIENLGGQGEFAESFAKVYWNKEDQKVFIDAMGLPEPPTDQEYQVWSLTLNPLSPTSIGLLSDFSENDEKIFSLANQNESQAFGITLEPKGGSVTPTMEKLYVLGILTID